MYDSKSRKRGDENYIVEVAVLTIGHILTLGVLSKRDMSRDEKTIQDILFKLVLNCQKNDV